jgi:DNA polymerase-4
MDVTLTAHLFGGVYPLIEKLKKHLSEEVGEFITVSVGISHNKLLAKLASGLKKPNGVVEIKPEQVMGVYKIAKLTDICGIGERIKARLNQMGISTLLQLRITPLTALMAEFGEVEGKFLKDIGMAIDQRPVVSYTEVSAVKSVGRSYCLPRNEYDQRIVKQNIYELCEEIAIKLRRLQKKTRTIGFYLKGNQSLHGRKTFSYYMDSGRELFEGIFSSGIVSLSLLARNDGMSDYTRQISIWVSNLEDVGNVPHPLFLHEQKLQKITAIIDKINEKFGDHTIRNGFLLYADKLTTVPNGYMADKYERAKLATFS